MDSICQFSFSFSFSSQSERQHVIRFELLSFDCIEIWFACYNLNANSRISYSEDMRCHIKMYLLLLTDYLLLLLLLLVSLNEKHFHYDMTLLFNHFIFGFLIQWNSILNGSHLFVVVLMLISICLLVIFISQTVAYTTQKRWNLLIIIESSGNDTNDILIAANVYMRVHCAYFCSMSVCL